MIPSLLLQREVTVLIAVSVQHKQGQAGSTKLETERERLITANK